ncbi:putative FBD-associated F-box protein At5g22720 [Arabidopsis lyrata subsp. lyrata]|uniref:putative FBD-associated F-box protein At5g22720 n=1 Tax=Arabidopsis lyrata subsp. lyrata TaxID=81972 RepID=UPI000A29E501|nr:putative FBD-associated F-box protein At5g22720 [Arabidopsis lyrata subsp. lyrata]XP_020879285.1 putative FBD-associated F-box protein At5g22720 [Arabidopsis lyrata subsp. lyrata]|eukprot:XP_020879284.1 putative FBD-associated F-box protein At5g22720 [Arabidopsis lyrata subsp. lyrata]
MADMISRLPDSLITQILLYLQTKEAVRTSVLSNRWKSVWLLIPKLDLDSSEFPDYNAFVGFMEKFLNFSREEKSCLYKLRLSIQKGESDDHSCVTRWIDFVATPKLKHLEVEFGPVKRECLEVMPLSLYIGETLLFLRLHRVFLGKFESVSLPCLKTMRLELNVYANETGLDLLISSCPVLEDLIIVRRLDDNVKLLRVRSQTLTSLSIEAGSNDDDVEALAEEFEYEYLRVLIDTHRLKYLNLEEDICGFDILSNLDSLTKINICEYFDLEDSADEADIRKRYMVRNFFTSISGIRDMKLSFEAYEFIMPIKLLSLQFCTCPV